VKKDALFEFSEALACCDSQDQIKDECAKVAHHLGYEHFIYGAYFPLVESIVLLNGFPDPWRAHYDTAKYMYEDPTVKHCSVNTSTINWSDIKLVKGRRGDAGREVMSEAKAYGLRQGVSMPVHGTGAEWGMLSLSSEDAHKPAISGMTQFHCEYIARAAHEALKGVVGGLEPDAAVPELTSRECECLQWTANGKTAWEISQILEVSESTVTFHLKNAITKMEVTNRPQAVAKAIAQSRIMLF
jgi:DNA-binding CsgD family transcriptional regulator